MDSAIASALESVGASADSALACGDALADSTRAKLAEQQERFKAGVVSQGRSLEDELQEWEIPDRKENGSQAVAGNKYAVLMDRRKHTQEQQKLSGS